MLERITPGDLSRSFITLGGTEANETAIKLCQQYTGKRKLISRYRSYHGGTGASMAVSSGDPRSWAAVTGANGIIVPPPEYFPMVREICDRYGILLIIDEVMSGFGRTGEWFAIDHWDVVPDIMTMAKGITSGYVPLGAAITRKAIGDHFTDAMFSHGATYAGHALGCAAAVEVVQIYEDDNLIENAAVLGAYLLEKSRELMDRHPVIGDVRGLGLFVGLELVRNRKTREPLIPVDARIRKGINPKLELAGRLGELGMIAMAANPSNVVAMAPPLIAAKDDIDEGIAIMDKALEVIDHYAEG